jgi:hypothetical protein
MLEARCEPALADEIGADYSGDGHNCNVAKPANPARFGPFSDDLAASADHR